MDGKRTCWQWLMVPQIVVGAWLLLAPLAQGQPHFGLLFDEHKLTLGSGTEQEALGPLYLRQTNETFSLTAFPPLFSLTRDRDKDLDMIEYDFLYPFLTYDRFGAEYRWQIFQIFNFSGGNVLSEQEATKHRFTLFPLIFYSHSTEPTNNYFGFLPFYGNVKHRLMRDELKFIMAPFYIQSRKRDVVTDNYLYPFYHERRGIGLKGWQIWPFFGTEHKDSRTITNSYGDIEIIGGHDKNFVLWLLYLNQRTGIGTDNPIHQQAILPFYSFERSPQRDSTTYLWPLGLTITDDRAKKYHEVGAPWPLIVFAHGEGKTTQRVFPFYSHSANSNLVSDFVLWPLYKYNRVQADPLDRERTRLLFFMFSTSVERNTETKEQRRRTDFWPLFMHRKENNGDERLQVLALLERLVPNSKSIERNYSPLWSIWRSEKNAETKSSSQSFLWNLYRHESAPGSKMTSFLFGMFQFKSKAEGSETRLFFIPVSKSHKKPQPGAENQPAVK